MKICPSCVARHERAEWLCPVCARSPDSQGGIVRFAPALAEENDGFSAESFACLALLESGSFWFRARNRLIVWSLQRHFGQVGSFLEIGCGTGFVLAGVHRAFPQAILAGSEIYDQGLSFARDRVPAAQLYQMDARKLPFEEEYDVVGAFDVLEHIDEDDAVLREMFRTVRKGGGIVVTVPQHPFLWAEVDDYSFHKRRYTRPELLRKVRAAGFQVERVTSFVSLLLPLMMLSRLSRRSSTPVRNCACRGRSTACWRRSWPWKAR